VPVYDIAVIPGDGIGNEVIAVALPILQAAGEQYGFELATTVFPWNCQYYLQHGEMMPADGLKQLAPFQAIYLGAVGYPSLVPDHISLHGLLLPIRRHFQQFVNMRPHRVLAGVESPLRNARFDILCIRENSEGEYVGAGGRAHAGTLDEVVIETAIFTRRGCERVMRFAFEQARRRSGRLAAATKSNAQRHSMVFWDEVFAEVSADYPEVETAKYHIDALSARFITHPESLDVVVASNLFGDILTDIGAAIQGGLGFAASGNIDPTRTYPSMFEPVHGSAPDIAGQGIANPSATIWAGSMMLDFLGEREAAHTVMQALEEVTGAGAVRTPDMGGSSTAEKIAGAVLDALRSAKPLPGRMGGG
jgi:tartrate dehydrogenase/decarboxylase/D-malate dehydrogenase